MSTLANTTTVKAVRPDLMITEVRYKRMLEHFICRLADPKLRFEEFQLVNDRVPSEPIIIRIEGCLNKGGDTYWMVKWRSRLATSLRYGVALIEVVPGRAHRRVEIYDIADLQALARL